jgi:hypothetical protein
MPTKVDTDPPKKQQAILLQTLTLSQPLKNFPHCMKPKGSSPCSQNPTFAPILSQINSVLALPLFFSNTHCNFVLPCGPYPSKWSVSFEFPHVNFEGISFLPHTRTYVRQFRPPGCDSPTVMASSVNHEASHAVPDILRLGPNASVSNLAIKQHTDITTNN